MNKIILVLSLCVYSSLSFAHLCENYQAPKNFIEVREKVDSKIKAFSNTPVVAKEADEALSKLIAAKSPVIVSWLSSRSLNAKSEEEIAREWRLYYAKNLILSKYPHNKAAMDIEIEKLMNEVNTLFASKDFESKMQSYFEKSKQASLDVIKAFPIKEDVKKKIVARIESIKLYWMKDFKTSKFKQLPLDFLDWGIAYDPAANEINIGVNALSYPNDETYLAVFAHEIGHSFDSCRWGAFFEGEWPFAKIGECLRLDGSVGAKKRDDSKLEEFVKRGKVPADLAEALKINSTCNKMIYPPAGVQADQLPESFADWFSAEAMATLPDIKAKNLRVDLCEKKDLVKGSSYPTNELRLENIYFSHPKLRLSRADLKNKNSKYCTW